MDAIEKLEQIIGLKKLALMALNKQPEGEKLRIEPGGRILDFSISWEDHGDQMAVRFSDLPEALRSDMMEQLAVEEIPDSPDLLLL
jgi:hypothetical protein